MKTTKQQRAQLRTGAWREFDANVLDRVVTDLLDDLDEALADLEAWKARAERAEAVLRWVAGARGPGSGLDALRAKAISYFAARPAEPGKEPGCGEP